MSIILFFILLGIFSFTCYIGCTSSSKLKYTLPFLFVAFISVTYHGINKFLGTPRTYGSQFLGSLNFANGNLTVIGGELTDKKTVLLIKETGKDNPILYEFNYNKTMQDTLRHLMSEHASENDGEQWGFDVTVVQKKKKSTGDGTAEETEFQVESVASRNVGGGPSRSDVTVKPSNLNGNVTEYRTP